MWVHGFITSFSQYARTAVFFPTSAVIELSRAASPQKEASSPPEDLSSSPSWFVFVGYVMLGLGDIALPGFLMCEDSGAQRRAQLKRPPTPLPPLPRCRAYARSLDVKLADDASAASEGGLDSATAAAAPRDGEGGGGLGLSEDRTQSATLPPRRTPLRAAPYLLGRFRAASCWVTEAARAGFVQPGYLRSAGRGYAVGVVLAMAIARTFRVAQPALLYIVPATLGPVVLRAWLLGPVHLRLVWGGFQTDAPESAAGGSSRPSAALVEAGGGAAADP